MIAEVDHPRIHQTPAERRVREHALAAREGLGRLERDERGAAHALDAAGDDQVGLARADASRGVVHRLEPAAAEAVHGHAGHGLGQAGEERGHAPDVAVVLARLVRRAEDHLVDLAVADVGPLEDRADDVRREVVRTDLCERAAVPAERRPDVADDESVAWILTHRPLNCGLRLLMNASTPSFLSSVAKSR